MKLDVIIATYNRCAVLPCILRSLSQATRPPELEITITVVDNNSDDGTAQLVQQFQKRGLLCLRYFFEPRQGKSRALNTAIEQADADLIAFIDDDMEVDRGWFTEISRLFSERWEQIDFAGGKVLPLWETPAPSWLPEALPGVLAVHDYGERELTYGESFAGELPGCQSLVKLTVLREIGHFNEKLGPVGKSLMGGEDDDMYRRLLQANKRGLYSPKLIAYHRIPSYRLSKRYFRHWCYNWGAAQSEMVSQSYSGPRVLRVPRYMYGSALRGFFQLFPALLRGDTGGRFGAELGLWILAGSVAASNMDRPYISGPLRKFLGTGSHSATR